MTDDDGPLTAQMVRDAMRRIREAPPSYCHPHMVHPEALRRGGLARCGGCGQTIDLSGMTPVEAKQ